MLILALESSAKPASAAVYRKSGLLGQQFQNSGFSHSRTLLAMAESLLTELNLKPSELNLIAVASGPGSFTGVRIGVSAAKGLAFGLDIPVCGVSTLEAMAYQTTTDALICPVMDARRSQVYNALFKWDNGKLIRLSDDRAISIEDLIAELKGFNETIMPVGDGTDLFLSSIAENGNLHTLMPDEQSKYQSARGVALASLHHNPVSQAELEPFYLRPSQAERNLNNLSRLSGDFASCTERHRL